MSCGLKYIAVLSVLIIGLISAAAVHAQDGYPSKPIQVVVTTAAGGALDLVARTVADRLSPSLHQPIIIDNQPAGNGSVAAGQFAKAMPDGHTLMMVVELDGDDQSASLSQLELRCVSRFCSSQRDHPAAPGAGQQSVGAGS